MTEIYERDCPYYLAIGMTYEEYWYGDPLMVRDFYRADKLRRERTDEEAWLYGLYVLNALNATVGNMFRKSGQPAEYPKEPFLIQKKREDRERSEREKEEEALWAKAWMSQLVMAGRNWGNKT